MIMNNNASIESSSNSTLAHKKEEHKEKTLSNSFRKGFRRIKQRFRSKKHAVSNGMGSSTSNPDLTHIGAESMQNSVCYSVTDLSSPSPVGTPDKSDKTSRFYLLELHLKEGKDLIACDISGFSDPYVKIKQAEKLLYKSRTIMKTLTPRWDEKAEILLDDITEPIAFKVFDYNRALSDDSMGDAELCLNELATGVQDVQLYLKMASMATTLGFISFTVNVKPLTAYQKFEWEKSRRQTRSESRTRVKKQAWCAVLQVILVEGSNLLAMDENGLSDPYVRLRLGEEKAKSKVRQKTLNPVWHEDFLMHVFSSDQKLEIAVYDWDLNDKDDFIGRAAVDLKSIERERTCDMTVGLNEDAGSIRLLLTITATAGSFGEQSDLNLASHADAPEISRQNIVDKYSWLQLNKPIKDVGWLQVKVIRAVGLSSADLGGKSDPFCVVQLVNDYAQTHTQYKTLDPQWNKLFRFSVRDIHSVLEVTIYDEDAKSKSEFLGTVHIPLLSIIPGKRQWFQLKNQKLLARCKGAIQLECDFIYNNLRAAIRTFNPAEEKYIVPDPKFRPVVLKRNIDRLTNNVKYFVNFGQFIQSCFDWESKARSSVAFIVTLCVVYFFEPWMAPMGLVFAFLVNLWLIQIGGAEDTTGAAGEFYDDKEEDDDDDDDKGKEEKKSFREKIQMVQDICMMVQEVVDKVASLFERVQNTFKWAVPWLSWLAIYVLFLATLLLYIVPVRAILFVYTIHKFTKKLRKPNAIPNNELLDYLSRVPDNLQMIKYREMKIDPRQHKVMVKINSTPG